MFWGGNKAAQPKQLSPELLKFRKEQIEQFEKYNTGAHSRNPEHSEWELSIVTQYGKLNILVIMGPLFPEHPPEVKVLARVTHRWVDKDMNVVGHPKLVPQAWNPNPAICHLGKIIREIYSEFARNPPMPQQAVQQPAPARTGSPQVWQPAGGMPGGGAGGMPGAALPGGMPGAALPGAGGMGGMPGMSPQGGMGPGGMMQPGQPGGMHNAMSPAAAAKSDEKHRTVVAENPVHTPLPEIPAKFPLLDFCDVKQLEELRDDPTTLNDMIEGMNSTIAMVSVRDDLYTGIEDLAKKNLARKPELDSLWDATNKLREELSAKQTEYQALAARQRSVLQKFSLKHVLEELDKGIETAEEQSDKIKSRYKSEAGDGDDEEEKKPKKDDDDDKDKGAMTTARFVKDYLKARKLVHMRQAKKEKLVELYGRPV